MQIDRFAHHSSWVHRWDPRWKIASLFVLMVCFAIGGERARRDPLFSEDLPPALFALAVSLGLVRAARIPLRSAALALRPALAFLGLLLLVVPLTYTAVPAAAGESARAQPQLLPARGLLVATLIALRALSILLLVFPMFGCAPFQQSIRALRALRLPLPLVQLIGFTYRYIHLFADEVGRVQLAWKARGFEKRCNPHTLRTLGNSVGMLIVNSMERSERVYLAMEGRGFAGRFQRFPFEGTTRRGDVARSALVLALGVVHIVWSTR